MLLSVYYFPVSKRKKEFNNIYMKKSTLSGPLSKFGAEPVLACVRLGRLSTHGVDQGWEKSADSYTSHGTASLHPHLLLTLHLPLFSVTHNKMTLM